MPTQSRHTVSKLCLSAAVSRRVDLGQNEGKRSFQTTSRLVYGSVKAAG